jgi:hypothetical protein
MRLNRGRQPSLKDLRLNILHKRTKTPTSGTPPQKIRQNEGDISDRRHLFRHLDHEETEDAENLNATAQRMVQKHAVSHVSVTTIKN